MCDESLSLCLKVFPLLSRTSFMIGTHWAHMILFFLIFIKAAGKVTNNFSFCVEQSFSWLYTFPSISLFIENVNEKSWRDVKLRAFSPLTSSPKLIFLDELFSVIGKILRKLKFIHAPHTATLRPQTYCHIVSFNERSTFML